MMAREVLATRTRWAAMWRQRKKGRTVEMHLLPGFGNSLPALFRTRRECREWIDKHYGYIRDRLDLRRPPNNWRMPQPVKVTVEYLR